MEKTKKPLRVKVPIFDIVPLKPLLVSKFRVPQEAVEWYLIGLEEASKQFVGLYVNGKAVFRLRFTRQDIVRTGALPDLKFKPLKEAKLLEQKVSEGLTVINQR